MYSCGREKSAGKPWRIGVQFSSGAWVDLLFVCKLTRKYLRSGRSGQKVSSSDEVINNIQ